MSEEEKEETPSLMVSPTRSTGVQQLTVPSLGEVFPSLVGLIRPALDERVVHDEREVEIARLVLDVGLGDRGCFFFPSKHRCQQRVLFFFLSWKI